MRAGRVEEGLVARSGEGLVGLCLKSSRYGEGMELTFLQICPQRSQSPSYDLKISWRATNCCDRGWWIVYSALQLVALAV